MMRLTHNRVGGSRVLVLGALLAMVMAAGMVLAAQPAHASTTFYVNSIADYGDANVFAPSCDTGNLVPGTTDTMEAECTLRAAIQQANYTTGADTINFVIPGSGVQTIAPATGLPEITGPVTINGYSQSGATPNTLAVGTNANLLIELDGSKVMSGDRYGLHIAASNSTIKGLVINRFEFSGIRLHSTAVGNKIEGNFIGTDASGTQDLGNSDSGVEIAFSGSNTVGGTSLAARNLISGNTDGGVYIGSDNQVRGNLIGTQKNGTTALGNGNDGVVIYGSSSIVAGNTIAFNAKAGVGVYAGNGNRVLSNSISYHAGLGIDLGADGPTANDSRDADTGPNHLQNKPVLSSARNADGKTNVKGALHTRPIADLSYTIQFFSNPSGQNEGQKLIGQKVVKTDGSGNVSFTFVPSSKVSAGRTITATATRNSNGDTSEFSAPRTVTTS